MVRQRKVLDVDALRSKENEELSKLSSKFSGVRKLHSNPAIYDVTECDSRNQKIEHHGVLIGTRVLIEPKFDRIKLVCDDNFIVATLHSNGEKRNFLYNRHGEIVFKNFVAYRGGFFFSYDFPKAEKKSTCSVKGLKVYGRNLALLNFDYEISSYEIFKKLNGENAIKIYPKGNKEPRIYRYGSN